MSKERKLGRGLSALFGEAAAERPAEEVSVEKIIPNPNQPRRHFQEEALQELAESIRVHGVVQPLIVRKRDDGSYDLIAGERRLRAAKLAGRATVPILVREYSDRTIAEIALVENLQREDLNPIEEGNAFKSLIKTYGYTQEKVAEIVGKSRPYVANMLRIITLPAVIQKPLMEGRLTVGQVRPLLALMNGVDMEELARRIMSDNLSAREVEDIVRARTGKTKKPAKSKKTVYAHFVSLENELKLSLGTSVHIKNGKGKNVHKGSISISFENEEEFQRIIAFLKNEE